MSIPTVPLTSLSYSHPSPTPPSPTPSSPGSTTYIPLSSAYPPTLPPSCSTSASPDHFGTPGLTPGSTTSSSSASSSSSAPHHTGPDLLTQRQIEAFINLLSTALARDQAEELRRQRMGVINDWATPRRADQSGLTLMRKMREFERLAGEGRVGGEQMAKLRRLNTLFRPRAYQLLAVSHDRKVKLEREKYQQAEKSSVVQRYWKEQAERRARGGQQQQGQGQVGAQAMQAAQAGSYLQLLQQQQQQVLAQSAPPASKDARASQNARERELGRQRKDQQRQLQAMMQYRGQPLAHGGSRTRSFDGSVRALGGADGVGVSAGGPQQQPVQGQGQPGLTSMDVLSELFLRPPGSLPGLLSGSMPGWQGGSQPGSNAGSGTPTPTSATGPGIGSGFGKSGAMGGLSGMSGMNGMGGMGGMAGMSGMGMFPVPPALMRAQTFSGRASGPVVKNRAVPGSSSTNRQGRGNGSFPSPSPPSSSSDAPSPTTPPNYRHPQQQQAESQAAHPAFPSFMGGRMSPALGQGQHTAFPIPTTNAPYHLTQDLVPSPTPPQTSHMSQPLPPSAPAFQNTNRPLSLDIPMDIPMDLDLDLSLPSGFEQALDVGVLPGMNPDGTVGEEWWNDPGLMDAMGINLSSSSAGPKSPVTPMSPGGLAGFSAALSAAAGGLSEPAVAGKEGVTVMTGTAVGMGVDEAMFDFSSYVSFPEDE